MKPISIPAPESLAAHERAAREIGELRRKGVPCHLEERAGPAGHQLDIVPGRPGIRGEGGDVDDETSDRPATAP
jgi:hypothetical protein